jgi:hypothetical protein
VVGVPDKTPEALSPRLVLQVPEQLLSTHVYGAAPPVAVREVL